MTEMSLVASDYGAKAHIVTTIQLLRVITTVTLMPGMIRFLVIYLEK